MDSVDVKRWHLSPHAVREREQANLRQQARDDEREARREEARKHRMNAPEAVDAIQRELGVNREEAAALVGNLKRETARFNIPTKKTMRRGNSRGR